MTTRRARSLWKGSTAWPKNLGIDQVMCAAGREHLKKIGAIPADEPGKAEGAEAPEGSDEVQLEGPSQATQWMSV